MGACQEWGFGELWQKQRSKISMSLGHSGHKKRRKKIRTLESSPVVLDSAASGGTLWGPRVQALRHAGRGSRRPRSEQGSHLPGGTQGDLDLTGFSSDWSH